MFRDNSSLLALVRKDFYFLSVQPANSTLLLSFPAEAVGRLDVLTQSMLFLSCLAGVPCSLIWGHIDHFVLGKT